MIELSVVITLYNEEQNIMPLCRALSDNLKYIDFEVILVDDGSSDNTYEEIKKINDPRFILVRLSTNYGQSIAMSAGIKQAEGSFIALMDGDLQNDPADIQGMLDIIRTGRCDVVAGKRENRKDGFLLRKLPSMLANALIRHYTGVKIHDYGCTLKVFRKEIARNLDLYGELHRFIPVLAALQGARIVQVPVNHYPRKFGRSKYGINRTVKVASDLILILFLQKYLRKPMHLFGGLGLVMLLPGSGILLFLLILKIQGNDIWGKPLLLLGILLLIVGVLFIMLGIMTELLMRVYYSTGNRELYNICEIINGKKEL